MYPNEFIPCISLALDNIRTKILMKDQKKINIRIYNILNKTKFNLIKSNLMTRLISI